MGLPQGCVWQPTRSRERRSGKVNRNAFRPTLPRQAWGSEALNYSTNEEKRQILCQSAYKSLQTQHGFSQAGGLAMPASRPERYVGGLARKPSSPLLRCVGLPMAETNSPGTSDHSENALRARVMPV